MILVGFGSYFAGKLGFVVYKKYTLQVQINQVQSKIEKLQSSKEELKKLVASLQDREFLKLKAKEEFNLKGEGEKVLVVKGILEDPESLSDEGQKESETNAYWVKWWNIFFGVK